MKVTMKQYEKQALDYSSRFKNWEIQAATKDAYLEAYKQALLDANEYIKEYGDDSFLELYVGQDPVEVEFNNGEHQLVDDVRIKKSTE
jgi:hypothetical protein